MADPYRTIAKWWKATRERTPAAAVAPPIDALLDRAAAELGLHSAFDWDLAGDIFGDALRIDDRGASAFDDHPLCRRVAEACRARAQAAAARGDYGDDS